MVKLIAKTVHGEVRGVEEDGVVAFKGIPYAAPPVGELRFRPPAPPRCWDGVRDASRFGATVPQIRFPGMGEIFGAEHPSGEDCLNLNVWTPDPGGAGNPVLVWIHGGGFQIGAGSDAIYDGRRFARDGVVVVTINYRLGIDGFLHLGDDVEGSGNFGMLDQVAALRWVTENIAAFGGDPGNVTIAGESAGALGVATLLAMPRARGFFRRAIAQSGAAHNGLPTSAAAMVADQVAGRLGVDRRDVGALRSLSTDRLLAVGQAVFEDVLATRDPARYGEVVAGPVAMPYQPTFGTRDLPLRPIDAIRAGSASGIGLLVGTTAEEFRSLLVEMAEGDVAPAFVETSYAMAFAAGGCGEAALATYRRNRPAASSWELLATLLSDWAFTIPAVRLAEAQRQHGPVHAYRFSWRSPAHDARIGAGHAVDVPFVFGNFENRVARWLTGDAPPRALADTMRAAWTAFVRSGNPGAASLPDWPAYDLERRATMCFDVVPCIVHDPAAEERRLWDGIL